MKFSGSFTAFVVASVATANLGAAASVRRDQGQVNVQGTSQSAAGPAIQTSNSKQNNDQDLDVKYGDVNYKPVSVDNTDNSYHLDNHPTEVNEATDYHWRRDVGQVNAQATEQKAAAPAIQDSKSEQDNDQDIDVDYPEVNYKPVKIDNTDNSKHFDNHPVEVNKATEVNGRRPVAVRPVPVAVRPVAAKPVAVKPVVVRPDHDDDDHHDGVRHGDHIVGGIVQNPRVKRRQGGAFGAQAGSANGQGGNSAQGQTNVPVVSGAGNSITTGGAQGAENNGFGGAVQQGLEQLLHKRLLFAGGQQDASANGQGGNAQQGQLNQPVLSGAGNSITTGGAQGSQANGQGGQIAQQLLQQLTSRGLGSALGLTGGAPGGGAPLAQAPAAAPSFPGSFGFAGAKQNAGANGFGGFSAQGQQNRPVLSGAGNSLTSGGAQGADNSGKGGFIGQDILQKLGAQKRQFPGSGAFGSQGASANGQGGFSSQFQSNRPVVSGFGNSVTTGGAQGATNNGQGGSIYQSLQQLLGRDIQGQGQGVGQGTGQFGNSDASGGNAFVVGANGPVAVDGSARGGFVGQDSASKQASAQSATQDAASTWQNNFGWSGYARGIQGQGQGIGQATGQHASAAAKGGNAFVAGANGPVFIKTAAQGGVVNQKSASAQEGQQSGTQAASSAAQNNFYTHPYWRREVQGAGQGTSQSTKQESSGDAKAGDVTIVGDHYDAPTVGWVHEPEHVYAPVVIDTSAKAGSTEQNSASDQHAAQKAAQGAKSTKQNNLFTRDPVQIVRRAAFQPDAVQIVRRSPVVADEVQMSRRAVFTHDSYQLHRRQFQGQNGDANAWGGSSSDFQVNGGDIVGNGKSYTSGGPQFANNSGAGGQLSQLINPQH